MNVFISWSGRTSKAVALALREFIQDVIQAANPWMSQADIDAGKRWSPEIANKLEESKFGIVCLSGDNLNSPWILFETGALAKSLEGTYVCPFLFNMESSDIPQGPLSQFQAKKNNQTETLELFIAINKALGDKAIKDDVLERVFKRSWPDFEKKLNNISVANNAEPVERNDKEILKEVLDIVRRVERHQMSYIDFSEAPLSLLEYMINRKTQQDILKSKKFRSKIRRMIERGLNPDELVHYLIIVQGIDEVYAKEFVEKEAANLRNHSDPGKEQRGR